MTDMHDNDRTDLIHNAAQPPLPLALSEKPGEQSTLEEIISHYRPWLPRYREFSQGRSNFQIEKLIGTEHATPAASYQHTIFQLRVMHQALMQDIVRGIERTREIEYKWEGKPKDKPVWWEQERGGKKLCWYDTDRLAYEHEMEELKMSVKDKLLQMDTFTRVLRAMEEKNGGPFTKEQLDAEEPEYWKLRFARQMVDEYLDRQTGLGTGNIKSLRMAVADSIIPGSPNKVEDFPDLFNAVLGGKEDATKILNEVNDLLLNKMSSLGASDGQLQSGAMHQSRNVEAPKGAVEKLKDVGVVVSDLED